MVCIIVAGQPSRCWRSTENQRMKQLSGNGFSAGRHDIMRFAAEVRVETTNASFTSIGTPFHQHETRCEFTTSLLFGNTQTRVGWVDVSLVRSGVRHFSFLLMTFLVRMSR